MIILNSAKAVSEIFDKRGSNYSDRPDLPMIVDLYALAAFCFYANSNVCAEWAGTGHSRSCVMVLAGRNTAAYIIVISIIASPNIKKYNWISQESSSTCCRRHQRITSDTSDSAFCLVSFPLPNTSSPPPQLRRTYHHEASVRPCGPFLYLS